MYYKDILLVAKPGITRTSSWWSNQVLQGHPPGGQTRYYKGILMVAKPGTTMTSSWWPNQVLQGHPPGGQTRYYKGVLLVAKPGTTRTSSWRPNQVLQGHFYGAKSGTNHVVRYPSDGQARIEDNLLVVKPGIKHQTSFRQPRY
jgi:hypothetical protein